MERRVRHSDVVPQLLHVQLHKTVTRLRCQCLAQSLTKAVRAAALSMFCMIWLLLMGGLQLRQTDLGQAALGPGDGGDDLLGALQVVQHLRALLHGGRTGRAPSAGRSVAHRTSRQVVLGPKARGVVKLSSVVAHQHQSVELGHVEGVALVRLRTERRQEGLDAQAKVVVDQPAALTAPIPLARLTKLANASCRMTYVLPSPLCLVDWDLRAAACRRHIRWCPGSGGR